ncbi:MAG: beta-1,3-glucanase family protein [Reyranella sp.]
MPAALSNANYVEFAIANNTGTSSVLYASLVSKSQAYKFTQYEASGGRTVYVAEVDDPTGGYVASVPLSSLVNEVDGTVGFYVKAFDGSPIAFTSGRLYFADQQNAVPYTGGQPGGIAPDASFDFDFIEFTVDPSTNQFNVDTTQVDQFGIPAYLQVSPKVPDYADGTGIVATQTRANVIAQFNKYTQSSYYAPYSGVVGSTPERLLAPQHVIDADPGAATLPLQKSFDGALDWLFHHYAASGGSHALYLVGNGKDGPEIFAGTVIDDSSVKDNGGNLATYRVFQFKGTGYCYNGATAALTNVGARGRATYQIFYPYFTGRPPYWFGGFPSADQKYNLPLTSAGRMVLGASGVFADDVSQKQYYEANGGLPANFDHTMLANLENQLCTMLNRGVTPGFPSVVPDNHHLRTGSNNAIDLIRVDLSKLTRDRVGPFRSRSIQGAATIYREHDLVGSGSKVWWNSLKGKIYFLDDFVQAFEVNSADIAQPFTLKQVARRPANQVTSAEFVFGTRGEVEFLNFDWQSAVNIGKTKIEFEFQYGPATTEAHYATLRLFSPYGQAFPFKSGDLGPTAQFAAGLTSGMTMTGISLDDPTYVHRADPSASHITIYSPQGMKPLNTNILTFSRFYPVDGNNAPIGQWNAYAAFFHIGDPANSVPAPTVDGKGYAFAYDDNGGYSSDITVQLPATQPSAPHVVTTLNLNLLAWTS